MLLMCQRCALLSLELLSYSCIFRALTILVVANISSLSLSLSPLQCGVFAGIWKFGEIFMPENMCRITYCFHPPQPKKRRSDCYSLACAGALKCVPNFALSCNI